MNVSIVQGDRRVDISIDGDSTAKLKKVQATARELFAATEAPKEPEKPYGFSLVSETETAA